MKALHFPHEIRRGSTVVRVYRIVRPATVHRESRTVFAVGWHAGGIRKIKQFAKLSEALDEARLKADQLASGKVANAAGFSLDDAASLTQARKIAGAIPILAALEEWARARELSGGQLLQAAKAWRDAHGVALKQITISEAVDEFIAAKRRAGVDVRCSYLKILPKLKTELGSRTISSLSGAALEAWIHEAFKQGDQKYAHPVTYNTVRKRLVSLWRWCRKQGYLSRAAQTEAEQLETAREESGDIGILQVIDFAKVLRLMQEEHPDFLACAVLAGFTGLRRSELHAQRWADVHLNRGILRVTYAKRNTPSKRLVPLAPAAVGTLRRAASRTGLDAKRSEMD